ncbi:hypothetical protein Dimus_017932 [Dionaea muscipula]
MEERLPADHGDHDPTPPPGDDEKAMQLVPSPWHRHHQTYVIQVPKDQIYRVPPPENAKIVERYRQPDQKKASPWRRCICCSIMTLVLIAILGGLGAAVYTLTLKPKPPHFEIKHLVTTYPPNTKSSAAPHPSEYDVLLEITNPNRVITLDYDDGKVSLHYKGYELGKGESPTLEQEGKAVDEVHLPINGSTKGILPKALEDTITIKSRMPKSYKKKQIQLRLKMTMLVKLKTWLSTKKKEFSVTCDFVVSSLTKDKDANIVSQNCETLGS